MKISGTVTDLPVLEDYEDARDKSIAQGQAVKVAIGLKKPGKGRPTFFRIVFIDDVAETVMRQLAPGDVITVTGDDASLRMVWEVDEISRQSPVLRVNGIGWVMGAPKR